MLSPEELRDRLREAADIVDQAALPADLRQIAFERALDVLGVGAATTSAHGNRATPPDRPDARYTEHTPASAGLLAQITSRLGLDADQVGRVYEEGDGQVRLNIKRSMLPEADRKAAAMRNVALLVAAGRQAAALEEYTPLAVLREECRDLRVLDPPNFAAEISKLEFRTRGGRNRKEAKANRHHYDEAAELIRTITAKAES